MLHGCQERGTGAFLLFCCTFRMCNRVCNPPHPPACSYLAPGAASSPSPCRCSLNFCHKFLKKLKSFIRSASNEPRAGLFTLSFGGVNSRSAVSHFADRVFAAEIRKLSFFIFFFNFPPSEIPCCPSSFSFLPLRFVISAVKPR